MRVQEQPPVQLDPQPRRFMDEAEILAKRHHQSQLPVTDGWRRIKSAIAGARNQLCCRQSRSGMALADRCPGFAARPRLP